MIHNPARPNPTLSPRGRTIGHPPPKADQFVAWSHCLFSHHTHARRPLIQRSSIVAALGGAAVALAAHAQSLTFDVIARSGQPAPGLPGLTLDTFFDARLGEGGDVSFSARLAGFGVTLANERSLWISRGGELELHHRQNDPAPFALDIRFDGAPFPRINASGQIGFTSAIFDALLPPTPPQPVRLSIFSDDTVFLRVIDAENTFSLPPLPPFNVALDTAYVQTRGPTGATTLIVTIGGLPTVLLETGDPAPVPVPGWTFSFIDQPTLNHAGDLAFRASITDGDELTTSLWRYSGGSLELIAWADPAPLAPGETAFTDFSLNPAISEAGVVTFWARQRGDGIHAGNDDALYRGTPGAITRLIGEGDPAPDLGTPILTITRSFTANSFGMIVFHCSLLSSAEPPRNNSVLYVENPAGRFTVLAREGQPAVGHEGARYFVMGPATINHHGGAAFLAVLEGPGVTNTTNLALFAADQVGTITPIVRTGEQFDVGGILKTITNISFAPGQTQRGDGTHSALGRLIFELRFEDRSTAIVTATVGCRVDMDGDQDLTIFDFLTFGTLFAEGHPRADFDLNTVFDIFDFLAFGTEFAEGCP